MNEPMTVEQFRKWHDEMIESVASTSAHQSIVGAMALAYITRASADALADAVLATLQENRHLADGDDCTLLRLKNALNKYDQEMKITRSKEDEV